MGMHPDACQTNRPNTHNDVVDAARAHRIDTPRFAPFPDPSVDTNVVNPNTKAIRYFLASDAYSTTNTAAELNALRASFAPFA